MFVISEISKPLKRSNFLKCDMYDTCVMCGVCVCMCVWCVTWCSAACMVTYNKNMQQKTYNAGRTTVTPSKTCVASCSVLIATGEGYILSRYVCMQKNQGPPGTPQGPPRDPQEPPRDPPGIPQGSSRNPQRPPGTPRHPPGTPRCRPKYVY